MIFLAVIRRALPEVDALNLNASTCLRAILFHDDDGLTHYSNIIME